MTLYPSLFSSLTHTFLSYLPLSLSPLPSLSHISLFPGNAETGVKQCHQSPGHRLVLAPRMFAKSFQLLIVHFILRREAWRLQLCLPECRGKGIACSLFLPPTPQGHAFSWDCHVSGNNSLNEQQWPFKLTCFLVSLGGSSVPWP